MKPTLPTIHLNGTHPQELADSYIAAMEALANAFDAVRATCPNGRDYYPQGDDVTTKALAEHYGRLHTLEKMREEIETLAIHCQDAADDREARNAAPAGWAMIEGGKEVRP